MKILLVVAGAFVFCSGAVEQNRKIKAAEWLIGTWENKTQRGSLYETWIKVNDTELLGKSYMLKEKDTIVFETVNMVEANDSLFYIPTVNNQNDNLPVRFAMKKISDSTLLFENQQHDFPQLIAYTKINADSLVAEISGNKNGKLRKQSFPMKRVKLIN